MLGHFSLEDRTALVTGASRGIGRAIALALAQANADVVCASRKVRGTDDTADVIRSEGQNAWQVSGDLSDRDDLREMVAKIEDIDREVDILVNNAGIIHRHEAVDYPQSKWDQVLEVNVTAVFSLCQHFGRRMLDRGSGKIINLASLLSFFGGVTVPPYTVSKHGVAGLTKALANEWAGGNVQVNAIAPGYIETSATSAIREDQDRFSAIKRRIPSGRWGKPSDLGGAAVFLASSASDYVNGHVLKVDGGWSVR